MTERSETAAAIERLRLSSGFMGDEDEADVLAVLAEVERLRNCLIESNVTRDLNAQEVERLRAEREALHSGESEAQFVDAVTGSTVGPLDNLSELTAGDAGNIWTAVLNVLTADPVRAEREVEDQ